MHMYVCPIPPSQKGKKKNAQLNLKLTGGHRLVLLKTGQLISLCERKRYETVSFSTQIETLFTNFEIQM